MQDLYDRDFYAWTQQQADALRNHNLELLDWENLIEEIESLGRGERRELRNRLAVLLAHLLKLQYQPDYPNRKSWIATVREQRRKITLHLQENPSLKAYQEKAIEDSYPSAIDLVIRETPLDYSDLPEVCPYSLKQILDPDFLQLR